MRAALLGTRGDYILDALRHATTYNTGFATSNLSQDFALTYKSSITLISLLRPDRIRSDRAGRVQYSITRTQKTHVGEGGCERNESKNVRCLQFSSVRYSTVRYCEESELPDSIKIVVVAFRWALFQCPLFPSSMIRAVDCIEDD